MSRSERLLELLQILRRHRHPVSGHDLAAELSISIRTLYRDIASLQSQGAVIEGEAGVGYVLRAGYTLPPLMFYLPHYGIILRQQPCLSGLLHNLPVLYFSPVQTMGGKDRLQSFTAQGILTTDDVYQADMNNGFCPYRRDVLWSKTQTLSIRPFLDRLELTKDKSSWAYQFRFGLLEISADDFNLVSEAMLIKQ